MRITLDKFRSFGQRQVADVAKLTLLVGENSSGKSSFLAGFRFMADLLSGSHAASFNRDPFFLGGYNHIAHYRGGKYGRAPSFELSLSERVSFTRKRNPRNALPTDSKSMTGELAASIVFNETDGEAQPSQLRVEFEDASITMDLLLHGKGKFCLHDRKRDITREIELEKLPMRFPPSSALQVLDYLLPNFVFMGSPQLVEPVPPETEEAFLDLARAAGNFANRLRPGVRALAPVRTRPRRSYDPTELGQSSEGDDLIKSLAQAARSRPEEWKKLQERIEKFGRQTQLFEVIQIKKLGRADSDPFQVHVKTKGREANIIDVGYGVSQALPLFAMLVEAQQDTLLIQQPEVHLHPIAQAAIGSVLVDVVSDRVSPDIIVETHSDFLVNRVLRHVRDRKIKTSNLKILFFEKVEFNTRIRELKVDENGTIIDPPEAYEKFFVDEALKNIGI